MTLFNQIELTQNALSKKFERKRLVFWYDQDGIKKELYDNIVLADVIKIEVANNEFSIKKRVAMDEPSQKFLIYIASAMPEDRDNWLLDLVMSGETFSAEATAFKAQEAGLDIQYQSFIDRHKAFFESAERTNRFAKRESTDLELKAMSVITATDLDYDKIWIALFDEALNDVHPKYKLMERSGFMPILWERAQKDWAYYSTEPSVKDLVVWFISSCHSRTVGKATGISPAAILFLNRWRENEKARVVFDRWIESLGTLGDVANTISTVNAEDLLESDIYPVVDKKIIREIVSHIESSTMTLETMLTWIEARRTKYYYKQFDSLYKALECAINLKLRVQNLNFHSGIDTDVFGEYTKENGWHEIDRLYRNYIYNSKSRLYPDALNQLTEYIDRMYCNSYLSGLSDLWQAKIDCFTTWNGGSYNIQKQNDFYNTRVKPYIDRGNRIFVVISDAFRYESAAELKDRLLAENRYGASLSATLGVLPSYTQLGMAAMLPHENLSFDKDNDNVYVDGVSSQGTANRTKILQKAYEGSLAINVEEFLSIPAKQAREDFKDFKVVYIYSNTIDKTGDDKITEGRVFEATEDEFDNLNSIIKHIANMNGNNIIITSDHGYIYQNSKLDQTQFTEFSPEGEVYKTNRRFVLGRKLLENATVNTWTAKQLGISGDMEFQTPKSLNRIRMQGAGSRFVHGGSSLQEVVVPVLEVSRKRKDTVTKVTVDVIGLPNSITGNIQQINFYQSEVVGGSITPREIKVAFYTVDGEQISDMASLIFNCKDGDSNGRQQKYQFTFTPSASNYNNQFVELRLEDVISGSSQRFLYRKYDIRMMIAFSSEFDF